MAISGRSGACELTASWPGLTFFRHATGRVVWKRPSVDLDAEESMGSSPAPRTPAGGLPLDSREGSRDSPLSEQLLSSGWKRSLLSLCSQQCRDPCSLRVCTHKAVSCEDMATMSVTLIGESGTSRNRQAACFIATATPARLNGHTLVWHHQAHLCIKLLRLHLLGPHCPWTRDRPPVRLDSTQVHRAFNL